MPKKRTHNHLNRDFNRQRRKDALSKEERSKRMSKIRSKKTKFEEDFINALKRSTRKKFVTNVRGIRGCPDIVFERYSVCVFLDSDFWHGWQYPRWKHLLKNDFWREKIEKNRKRDRRNTAYLRRKGWTVIRFWEHRINSEEERKERIEQILYILQRK